MERRLAAVSIAVSIAAVSGYSRLVGIDEEVTRNRLLAKVSGNSLQ